MYLGLKPSSVLLNATQNYTLGWAELSRYTKFALVKLTQANADVIADHSAKKENRLSKNVSASERSAIETAIRKGLVHENIIGDMIGEDQTFSGKTARGWQALARFVMTPFQIVEQMNRGTMFLAAYRVFVDPDFKPTQSKQFDQAALDRAMELVHTTQFIPGRANLPKWARKPLGKTAYTLTSFSFNTINWMYNRGTSFEKD
jgi:hypothetical protein